MSCLKVRAGQPTLLTHPWPDSPVSPVLFPISRLFRYRRILAALPLQSSSGPVGGWGCDSFPRFYTSARCVVSRIFFLPSHWSYPEHLCPAVRQDRFRTRDAISLSRSRQRSRIAGRQSLTASSSPFFTTSPRASPFSTSAPSYCTSHKPSATST